MTNAEVISHIKEESMVTPDTKKYWKKLSAIPWSQRGELRFKIVPWIYTNDCEFSSILPQISKCLNLQPRTHKPQVAVLSGVGSILNVARLTDVDFFISVDRNSFVLDQVRKMVETIKDAETPEEFLQEAQHEVFFPDFKDLGADPEPYWEMERESFGPYHFLATKENYKQTRNTLIKTPVYCTQGNFTHPPYVKALGHALEGTEVSYASFTDLAEWSPEFLDVIHYLPMNKNAVVVWATNKDRPKGKPLAKYSIVLSKYIEEQRNLLNGLSVDYFKTHV